MVIQTIMEIEATTKDDNMYLDGVEAIMKNGDVVTLDIITLYDIDHSFSVKLKNGVYDVSIKLYTDADDDTKTPYDAVDPKNIAYLVVKADHEDGTTDKSFNLVSLKVRNVDMTNVSCLLNSGEGTRYGNMWTDGIKIGDTEYTPQMLTDLLDAMKIERGYTIYSYVTEDHVKLSDLRFNCDSDAVLPPVEMLSLDTLKAIAESYESWLEEGFETPADAERSAVYEVIYNLNRKEDVA